MLVGDVVEVIVKKQDKTKRPEGIPVKSTSNTVGQKASAEKKRSTPNRPESLQNWGHVFGSQNLLHMKQMQSSSKSTKHTENKEAKKNSNVQQLQKNRNNVSIKYVLGCASN